MTEAEQERAAVVAWLRKWAGELTEGAFDTGSIVTMARALEINQTATAIERMHHLPPKDTPHA